MSLPEGQAQSNPFSDRPVTSVETSLTTLHKKTWSVSVGGVSYLIDDVFSSKLESTISLALEYSCLLTEDQAQFDINPLKNHLTSLASRFMREPHELAAQEATKDFVWPADAFTRDLADLKSCGSIKELIRARQNTAHPSRINGARVTQLFRADPQFDKLYQLAEEGVIIDPPEGFVKLTQPPKMRPLQKKLVNAFRIHALKRWRKGKIPILPYAELDSQTIQCLHFNCVHWTIKPKTEDSPGNILGRPLIDPSHGPVDSILNTPDAKTKAIERYNKCNDTDMTIMVTKGLNHCTNVVKCLTIVERSQK